MRRAAIVATVMFIVNWPAAGLRPAAVTAAGQAAPPDKVVGAFLDNIYARIAADHPNPEQPSSRGLYRPPPIANNDRTRRDYRIASGLSGILWYDFVKLAVIEERRYRFKMFKLVAALPDGSPAVTKARDAIEMLWLCDTPNKLSFDQREADLIRHTDGYLSRVVPAQASVKERGSAVLEAFVRACTFGMPASEMPQIRRPLGESPLFAASVTFAQFTGLPFEQVARVESIGGPLVLYGLARALPKGQPGRDEALAALRSDREWTYPPK